jgi:hypothetical protein
MWFYLCIFYYTSVFYHHYTTILPLLGCDYDILWPPFHSSRPPSPAGTTRTLGGPWWTVPNNGVPKWMVTLSSSKCWGNPMG